MSRCYCCRLILVWQNVHTLLLISFYTHNPNKFCLGKNHVANRYSSIKSQKYNRLWQSQFWHYSGWKQQWFIYLVINSGYCVYGSQLVGFHGLLLVWLLLIEVLHRLWTWCRRSRWRCDLVQQIQETVERSKKLCRGDPYCRICTAAHSNAMQIACYVRSTGT